MAMTAKFHLVGASLCLYLLWAICTAVPLPTYLASRAKLLGMEKVQRLGGKIILTDKEHRVNQTLMMMKEQEFQAGLLQKPFASAMHFFHARSLIDDSEVFDVIQMMPKGAALHIHDVSLVNISWFIDNLTYLPNLYYCNMMSPNQGIHFSFNQSMVQPNCSSWELVADARKNDPMFNERLFSNLSMLTDDPHTDYPDTYKAWEKFQSCLFPATELVYSSEEVFQTYMTQAMQEFYDDNVQYMEIRYLPLPLITASGTQKDANYTLEKYINITNQFKEDTPDLYGVKFISQSIRSNSREMIGQEIRNGMFYKQHFSGYYAGHDLVAQEDTGYSLLHYIKELLQPSQTNKPLPYFFHAGETDWEGTHVDENLFDAVLLNATRIGHGYAITKHPVAMDLVKKKDIAIEVNPISNQVLGLLDDLRNHPAAGLISQDFPLVISSDDPAVWGAKPMSHDFYEAFMALGGARADLATLKQFALNSINYSATTKTEKQEMTKLWNSKWDEFLDKVLDKYGEKYRIHTFSPPCPCEGEEQSYAGNFQPSKHISNGKIQIMFVMVSILFWRKSLMT